MSLYRQTGKMPDQLANAPSLPDGLSALWLDFAQMHECRGSTGFGPMRISFADVQAFQAINRVRHEPWEIEAIRRADNAFLAQVAQRHAEESRQ